MNNKPNVKLSDVILFPGKSCYPFTEGKGQDEAKGNATVRSDDQLIKVLELVGLQEEKAYSFLTDKSAIDYLRLIQSNIQIKGKLEDKFKTLDPDFVGLLKSMLTFNPGERMSARECLNHNVFDEIRDPQLEFTAPFKIKVHD